MSPRPLPTTTFRPGPQLSERVAARWAVPEAHRLTQQLVDRVKANVPPAHIWITVRDDRVRPTHVSTDGQSIPGNLRFEVEHPREDNTYEMAREPRDAALSLSNRINCRCRLHRDPGMIGETVASSGVLLQGTRATATVSVNFHRIVESEHPGSGDDGGGWLARSVAEVAAARAVAR